MPRGVLIALPLERLVEQCLELSRADDVTRRIRPANRRGVPTSGGVETTWPNDVSTRCPSSERRRGDRADLPGADVVMGLVMRPPRDEQASCLERRVRTVASDHASTETGSLLLDFATGCGDVWGQRRAGVGRGQRAFERQIARRQRHPCAVGCASRLCAPLKKLSDDLSTIATPVASEATLCISAVRGPGVLLEIALRL